MASRFYLPSVAKQAVSVAVGSIWEETAANAIKTLLVPGTPSGTPIDTDRAITKVTTGAQRDILAGQFVSPPLASAGTLSGTFSYVGFHHFLTDRDAYVQARVAVVSGDGQTLRGEFYAGSTATVPSASTTSPQYEILGGSAVTNAVTRIFNALAGSSVSYNAGDRIVFEIGFRDNVANLTSPTTYFRFGDAVTGITDLALAVNTAHTTTQRPWFELSQTLTFLTEADVMGVETEVLAEGTPTAQVNSIETEVLSDTNPTGQISGVSIEALGDIAPPTGLVYSSIVEALGDIAPPTSVVYSSIVEALGDISPPTSVVYSTIVEALGDISPPTSVVYSSIVEALGTISAVELLEHGIMLEVMGNPPLPGLQDVARTTVIKVKGSDGEWYPLRFPG